MKAQLPEFRSCFGICSLRVGVYIIATIGLILHAISISLNGVVLSIIIRKRNLFSNIDSSAEHNVTEEALETLMYWSTIGLFYYGIWLLIKCVIFITYGVLLFGIWKKIKIILKIYMYIYAPYWLITLIEACVLVYFVNIAYNIFIVAILIIDTYLMLIVRSTYREMSGKRRFLERSQSNDAHNCSARYEPYENPPVYTLPTNPAQNSPHCSTCTCIQSLTGNERNPEEDNDYFTLQSPTSSETKLVSNTPNESAELNFKEEHIIYDQNQLQTSHSYVIEERLNNITEIPSSSNNMTSEVKKNIEDVPIIFDQSQLNVGTSPLFENMHVIESPTRSKSKSHSSEIISNSNPQLNNHMQVDFETKIKTPRPNTLALRSVEKRTKIFENEEIPVIYYQHQFSDGSTNVTEKSRSFTEEPATLTVECTNMNTSRSRIKSRSDDEQ